MQLLRIGGRFINLDLVTEFSFDSSGVNITYDHDHTTRITNRHEMVLLRQWLEAHARDHTPDLGETEGALDLLPWDDAPTYEPGTTRDGA